MSNKKKEYDIRTITEITGITPIRLRAWENRYQLLKPKRNQSGRRIYTTADLEKLQKIIHLLNQGFAIGQIEALLEPDNKNKKSSSDKISFNQWAHYHTIMLHAIAKFDLDNLDNIYNEAIANYPFDLVIIKLIKPIFLSLGEKWSKKKIGIAEEHFFSNYIRNRIGSRILHLNSQRNSQKPLILLACLPHEQHELGLLFFGLYAMENGFKCLMLGTNLPLSELERAIKTSKPLLSILHGSLDSILAKNLGNLAKTINTKIAIVQNERSDNTFVSLPEKIFLLSNEFSIAIKAIRKIISRKTRN